MWKKDNAMKRKNKVKRWDCFKRKKKKKERSTSKKKKKRKCEFKSKHPYAATSSNGKLNGRDSWNTHSEDQKDEEDLYKEYYFLFQLNMTTHSKVR